MSGEGGKKGLISAIIFFPVYGSIVKYGYVTLLESNPYVRHAAVGNLYGAVGNLNGVKPSDRVVKRSWVKFKWEEVKCRKV